MKILLVVPPAAELIFGKMAKDIAPSCPPLGLLYIASILEKKGFIVKLVDCDAEKISIKDLLNIIKEYNPDILGLTCVTTTFKAAVEVAKLTKENSNALVLIGGPHATVTADEILEKYTYFDIVIRGEGDYSFLDIALKKNLRHIDGISYLLNNKVYHNKPAKRIDNLDDLPFPAYHLINFDLYKDHTWNLYGNKIAPLITSRGCPYECTFCASKTIFGRLTKFRSAQNIVEEINLLKDRYNIDCISFIDDTFTINKELVFEISQELKRLKLKWICNARVDTVDFETLRIMKESGCCLVQVGVESGDDEVLKSIKKGTSLDKISNFFRCANKLHLDTLASFIIGLPEDTRETISKTIKFAEEINPTYSLFYILTPYPGTEICRYAVENKLLLIDDWTEMKAPKYETPSMKHKSLSGEELKQFQKRAYRRVYLRPRYIFTHIIPKLGSWNGVKFVFNSGTKLIKHFVL